ncbi:MAG TPA: class I SAM-dependent methyltransferase [Bacteroidia bacterium]|nr:class I SAM-dependent methyltransferase [Bacteroidia bacterium]
MEQYAAMHSDAESDLLKSLNRHTYARVLQPRMLSGHLQGRILAMLSRMIQPKAILEIGTYTGYSALCLAEGLQTDGVLHSIDINPELHETALQFVQQSPYHNQIHLHVGDALHIIPAFEIQFDLVFIDADKENYCTYLDLAINCVHSGGYIIADNVLWSGNVVKPENEQDRNTAPVIAFNKKVLADVRLRKVLLPVRDGLMICQKI